MERVFLRPALIALSQLFYSLSLSLSLSVGNLPREREPRKMIILKTRKVEGIGTRDCGTSLFSIPHLFLTWEMLSTRMKISG